MQLNYNALNYSKFPTNFASLCVVLMKLSLVGILRQVPENGKNMRDISRFFNNFLPKFAKHPRNLKSSKPIFLNISIQYSFRSLGITSAFRALTGEEPAEFDGEDSDAEEDRDADTVAAEESTA